ncbi:MAG: lactate utilization protein [Candidatus Coatesbacteria bacterium]|nr:lactate utilization protein [Candidatus Coatesbacteria bacterium]
MPNAGDEKTRRSLERYHRLNAEAVTAQLEALGYRAVFVEDREAALRELLERVPAEAVVGAGGSLTLAQLGALEALRERGHEILYAPVDAPREEKLRIRRRSLSADVFLSGVNALSADGEIVNLDGLGNRVAGLSFGPERVILVCGINKLCPDLESAVVRVREKAAPANAMRLEKNTPCAATGYCHDCDHAERICNRLLIHLRAGHQQTHLILVDENLGL